MTTNTDTKYTAQEVLDAFEAHEEQHDGDYGEVWYEGPTTLVYLKDASGEYIYDEPTASGYRTIKTEAVEFQIDGVPVEVKVLATTGGEEQGSHASILFQVGSQFFRKHGYYASHYGYDWDGIFEEVIPVEKTVTVYEAA